MPKVASMIFDIEMESDITGSKSSKQPITDQLDTGTVVEELKRFLLPVSSLHQQLLKDVSSHTCGSLSSHLTSLGYLVRVRKSIGGGEGSHCLHNLRHEFLHCIIPGDSTAFIVDPHFLDQFEIAKPTDRYSSLLACIPAGTVCLPEDHVQPLVTFLCAEMSTAFKASNTVLPPWRQVASMLTKWQPRKSIDESSLRRSSVRHDQSAPHVMHGGYPTSPTSRVYGFGTTLQFGHLAN